jgi:hypothetical protein
LGEQKLAQYNILDQYAPTVAWTNLKENPKILFTYFRKMRFLIVFSLFFQISFASNAFDSNEYLLRPIQDTSRYSVIQSNKRPTQNILRKLTPTLYLVRDGSCENFLENDRSWKWILPPEREEETYLVLVSRPLDFSGLPLEVLGFESNTYRIQGTLENIKAFLLPKPEVLAVQTANRLPQPEATIRQHDLTQNTIQLAHHQFPTLLGSSVKASVKEDAFNATDIDLETRVFTDVASSSNVVSHATEMATLMAGAGNSFVTGRGVARGATLFSAGFTQNGVVSLFPHPDSYFTSRGITVQNHSYGVNVENGYGLETVQFDLQAINQPTLLHVFSAGNRGTAASNGLYSGLTGVANLTGFFKHAKNALVVTASNQDGEVIDLNSSGPAHDGRLKPELTAFGGEGTSESAALVSGSAILIQEHFKVQTGQLPTSDMVKGLLIAGAVDIGTPGPDFKTGYGRLDLSHSLNAVDEGWFETGTVADGQTLNFDLTLSQPAAIVNVVLVWRDPPANAGDLVALVHDLDLKVVKDADEWLPWILDPSPSLEALAAPATTGIDRLNNVEMVTLRNVQAGIYQMEVTGYDVQGTQDFSLAWYILPENHFAWTYPTASDPQRAGATVKVRWETAIDEEGFLEMDFLDNDWQSIDNIPAGSTTYSLQWPTTFSQARLRMTIDGQPFVSDVFTINPSPALNVELLCDDLLMLNWENLGDDVEYEVLAYSNGALNQVDIRTDTVITLNRNTHPGLFYSVKPYRGIYEGLGNPTVRVDQQGAGCFLNNFLVSMNPQKVVTLTLSLSAYELIENVTISKSTADGIEVLHDFVPTQKLHVFQDDQLLPGRTRYQAKVTVNGRDEILSEEISIFTTDDRTFDLFPNPATQGFFYFLSPIRPAIFQFLNVNGQVLSEYELFEEAEAVPVPPDFQPGLYLYRIVAGGRVVNAGRVVIR